MIVIIIFSRSFGLRRLGARTVFGLFVCAFPAIYNCIPASILSMQIVLTNFPMLPYPFRIYTCHVL